MTYNIIVGHELIELVDEVRKQIAKGWRPLGGPFIYSNPAYRLEPGGPLVSGRQYACQAMTMEETEAQ